MRQWLMFGAALVFFGTALAAPRAVGAQGPVFEVRPEPQRARRPRLSPHESVTADVAGATVTIVYGRPSMRGRKIFGRLVPWDEVWCPGADEATTLTSTRPLQIGALRVPQGPHTIWVLPTPERWTFVVSQEPAGFHLAYDDLIDLGRVEMQRRTLAEPVEQLTFAIDPAAEGDGAIRMAWETTEVSVPFRVVQ